MLGLLFTIMFCAFNTIKTVILRLIPFNHFRTLLVMLESLAGTGHKIVQTRPKQATEKLEMIWFDPFGEYLN